MKKTLLPAVLCLALTFASTLKAQTSYKSSQVGIQPLWGPAGFNMANYYYIPDIEAYYDVFLKQFIYLEDGEWVFSKSLPAQFANIDLFSAYKVVINLPQPYLNFSAHRVRYARYKGQLNRQTSIRDSTRPKYAYVPGHNYTFENVLKTPLQKMPK